MGRGALSSVRTDGSVQLRRYRDARRAGLDTATAESVAQLVPGEGALIDAEDELNPPPAPAPVNDTTRANTSRNFRSTTYDRADSDWYVEPRWCVEQQADSLSFPTDGVVWDPCCGGGTIAEVFGDRHGRHRVIATDLVDRGYPALSEQWDATQWGVPLCVKPNMRLSVVTNPPFKLAESIIRRMLAVIDHRLVILQSVQFLASRARHALFTEFPPSDVLVLSSRPSMPPGHIVQELGDRAFKGGTTDYCWIVWTKPHDRETRLQWLPPRRSDA